MKLLAIDDSALMRRLIGQAFAAERDIAVSFAQTGAEALTQVDALKPDVVTLDIHLPDMDGLACLDRIMLLRPCPVVMVSALTEAGADVTLRALELGAVDFIAKPEGALSLSMDRWAPRLVEKVRAAASARVRSTTRLRERVRARFVSAARAPAVTPAGPSRTRAKAAARRVPTAAKGPRDGYVLVGCSTGGPQALERLLVGLPVTFPWPIIVAQHMPATFTGPLSHRLDKLCALHVVEVVAPMTVEVGHVYVGRGDADIIVSTRASGPVVMPAPMSPAHRWHPSVERLVLSALDHLGAPSLTGILMTGMGNDGASAMTRLGGEGGRTIAEAEETAVVWGMPGELVRAGGAQIVAPLDEIASRLMDMLP